MQNTALRSSYAFVRPPGEIIGIQAMRYLAALAVLVDHFVIRMCEQGALPASLLPWAHRTGALGVYVFFAISGFVMVLTNRDKFDSGANAIDFFLRRIIRIWPRYFVATMLVFAAFYGKDPVYTFGNLLKSLSFLPYIGVEGLYRPVLGKGWTLNYEMFFYAVFALCLCVPRKAGLALAAVVLVGLGISGGSDGGVLWKFYADKIVIFFLIGMVIGVLTQWTGIRWPQPRSAAVAVAAGCAAFAVALFAGRLPIPAAATVPTVFLAVSACLYLVCSTASRFRNAVVAHWVAVLGDSSYCLYLFHGFIMVALLAVLKRLPAMPPALTLALVIVAATVGCVLIHLYLEKPVNGYLMAAYKRRRSVPAVPAAPEREASSAG